MNYAADLESATGAVDYGFINDYMFRAVFQQNETALRGLICSAMNLEESEIKELEVLNPIELGKAIDAKTFVMDIKVIFNNNTVVDLEMQVINEGNWPERSLVYLCRNFDNLNRGMDYIEIKKAVHIGFVNFTLFPDYPEFCSTYMLQNVENNHLYSRKFLLKVIDLKQIELATDNDRRFGMDRWAKLFNSKTWEELKMCAGNNEAMNSAVKGLFKLNTDWIVREQCEAREAFYAREAYLERMESQYAEMESQCAKMESQCAEMEKQQAEMKSQCAEMESRYTEMESQQADMKNKINELSGQVEDKERELEESAKEIARLRKLLEEQK